VDFIILIQPLVLTTDSFAVHLQWTTKLKVEGAHVCMLYYRRVLIAALFAHHWVADMDMN
jgi:hypothetical protein